VTDKENDIEFLDDDNKWEFNDTFTEVFNENAGSLNSALRCHEEIDTGF
jgi:hypothetical protein